MPRRSTAADHAAGALKRDSVSPEVRLTTLDDPIRQTLHTSYAALILPTMNRRVGEQTLCRCGAGHRVCGGYRLGWACGRGFR